MSRRQGTVSQETFPRGSGSSAGQTESRRLETDKKSSQNLLDTEEKTRRREDQMTGEEASALMDITRAVRNDWMNSNQLTRDEFLHLNSEEVVQQGRFLRACAPHEFWIPEKFWIRCIHELLLK